MHTSFSSWLLPYFPSFGLKRTNKPSIFKFSEECFPSSWFLNAFKWKKELKIGCCLGDLQALWNYCFSASWTQWLTVPPPDSQLVGLGWDSAVQYYLSLFFFMSFTTEWKLELIFHGLVVLHSYSVPAEFMHFANNIYSPFSFSTPGLYGILVFMLLALPHICLTLIRSDQLAKLEYKKAFCRWGPVVISNWCIVWEPNPICPLAVGPAAPYPPHRGRFFSLGIIDSLAW